MIRRDTQFWLIRARQNRNLKDTRVVLELHVGLRLSTAITYCEIAPIDDGWHRQADCIVEHIFHVPAKHFGWFAP